jgi:hypothetical protein
MIVNKRFDDPRTCLLEIRTQGKIMPDIFFLLLIKDKVLKK